MAASGGAVRLPQRLPWPIAMELLLLGEPVDAQRAHELGLVNRVVPGLAAKMAAYDPHALGAAKRVAHASVAGGEAAGWEANG